MKLGLRKKLVMFDFDGVIADTFSMAFAIHEKISPGITQEGYRKLFEGNINDHHEIVMTAEERVEKNRQFFALYEPELMKMDVLPGMGSAIQLLSEKYTLGIVSSTNSDIIRKFLEKKSFNQCFSEILGNDVNHSKVIKIQLMLDKYATEKSHCVFITDTLGDMLEAEKCGVKSIGVSWGYHPVETLRKGNPLGIASTPDELTQTITHYLT